jgi:WS/DGAT/MGAT family acyltransferase
MNVSRPADVACDRLSPLDAWFLYLERPTELLHVGAIAVLEAPPSFEGLVDTLGQRLAALRRYRQVPVRPTLDLGPPRWRDDPEFDLRRHIKRVTVPASGDDATFQRVFEELFGRPFASEHPLWECYLLEGLAGGRAALLTKVHHCMIDGVSGMQVLEVMTDGQTTSSGAGRLASPADATATPLGRYLTGLTRELFGGLESVLRVVTDPGRAVANLRATVAAAGVLADLTRERLRPFSFNGTLSHTRRIVWATFDLDEFLAIRGAAGCKVNDVALAVIAGALRRFLPVEATARGRRARALIPMSIRRDDEYLTLGNRVSGMFASLPLDVADARERLHLIAAEMRAHKEGGQALAFDFALAVLGAVPTVLAPLIARLPRQWPVAHTVCTNVPGPREPRSLLGQRVLALHPVVPLAVDIGLGFAILSYAGTVSITATADATLVPDVDRLPAALTTAADELACQFGVRAAAARPRAKRRTALTVSDLMTRDVVTIGPHELLATAWRTMHTRRIRHLPVVDRDGVLRGLVTHRDLLAASPSSLSLQAESDRVRLLGWAEAADVMETHVSTAAPGESAADVGLRMVRQKIGCLPVVDAGGAIVGIVTEEDFLRWSAENMAAADEPGLSAFGSERP